MSHLPNSTESHLHLRASFHLFIFPSLAQTVLILGLKSSRPLATFITKPLTQSFFTTSFLDTPVHTPMIILATPSWGNITHLSSNTLPSLHLDHSTSATAAPALNKPLATPMLLPIPFPTGTEISLSFLQSLLEALYFSSIPSPELILLTLDAISSPGIHSEFVPAHSQLDVNLIIPSSTERMTRMQGISPQYLFPTSVNPHTAFPFIFTKLPCF